MNVSAFFIRRPVATLLLTAALTLAGIVAYRHLPVAALPHIDIPTITISAALPGAGPETMASTVSTPLIREFSTVPSVREINATNVRALPRSLCISRFNAISTWRRRFSWPQSPARSRNCRKK
jgi:HAE1 family hydrophobic/amphiphilic exporter-1